VEKAHYCGVDCDPGCDIFGGGHNLALNRELGPVSCFLRPENCHSRPMAMDKSGSRRSAG
jgi:hypothetical protein